MELRLEYPSHSLIVAESENPRFIKVTNYVSQLAYNELQTIAIENHLNSSLTFVEAERILLNNFLRSILSYVPDRIFYQTFSDELSYYIFCIARDVPYKEQEWFKTAYIEATITQAQMLLVSASIKLEKLLFPGVYKTSIDIGEQIYREQKLREERDLARWKPNYKSYISKLEDWGIKELYHFTSMKNIESIKANGLLSESNIRSRGIKGNYISSESSRSIDSYKGLADYIHLGYEYRHPMLMRAIAEGNVGSYLILTVDVSVMFLKDTLYTDMNVAANSARVSSELSFLDSIPFSRFHNKDYLSLDKDTKRLFMSEVLVKGHIDSSLITNL